MSLWWALSRVNAGALRDPTQWWAYWPGDVSSEILAKGAACPPFFPGQSRRGEVRSSGGRQALSGPGDTQPAPTLGTECGLTCLPHLSLFGHSGQQAGRGETCSARRPRILVCLFIHSFLNVG